MQNRSRRLQRLGDACKLLRDPSDWMEINTAVMVVEWGTPERTKGSDWKVTLKVIDPGYNPHLGEIDLLVFATTPSCLPQPRLPQDIIKLQEVKLNTWRTRPQLVLSMNVKGNKAWALFPGTLESAHSQIPRVELNSFYKASHINYRVTAEDIDMLQLLRASLLLHPAAPPPAPLMALANAAAEEGATRAPALPPPVLPGLLHSMMPQPAGPPAGLGPSYLPIPSFTRRISGAVAQAAGAQPGAAGPSGGPPMPGAGSSGAGPAAMQVDQCAGPASGAQVNAHPRGQPQGPIQVPQPQKTVLRKVRDLVASVRAQPPEMVDILCRVLALDWRQPGFCIAFVWDATDIQPTEKQESHPFHPPPGVTGLPDSLPQQCYALPLATLQAPPGAADAAGSTGQQQEAGREGEGGVPDGTAASAAGGADVAMKDQDAAGDRKGKRQKMSGRSASGSGQGVPAAKAQQQQQQQQQPHGSGTAVMEEPLPELGTALPVVIPKDLVSPNLRPGAWVKIKCLTLAMVQGQVQALYTSRTALVPREDLQKDIKVVLEARRAEGESGMGLWAPNKAEELICCRDPLAEEASEVAGKPRVTIRQILQAACGAPTLLATETAPATGPWVVRARAVMCAPADISQVVQPLMGRPWSAKEGPSFNGNLYAFQVLLQDPTGELSAVVLGHEVDRLMGQDAEYTRALDAQDLQGTLRRMAHMLDVLQGRTQQQAQAASAFAPAGDVSTAGASTSGGGPKKGPGSSASPSQHPKAGVWGDFVIRALVMDASTIESSAATATYLLVGTQIRPEVAY